MVEASLRVLLDSVPCSSLLKSQLLSAVTGVEGHLMSKVSVGVVSVGPKTDVGGFIKSSHERASEVEAGIRDSRIRDAERKQADLRHKLEAVQESLVLLQTEQKSPSLAEVSKAQSLQSRRVRHQFMEEESAKTNEAAEFARKLHREQLVRKRRQRERGIDLANTAFKETEEFRDIKQRYDAILAHQKEQKRQLIQDRAEARREEKEMLRKAELQYRSSISPVPKFRIYEGKFKAQRAELKKQELTAKRNVALQPSVHSLNPTAGNFPYAKMSKASSSVHFQSKAADPSYKTDSFEASSQVVPTPALKRLAIFHGDAETSHPVRTKRSVEKSTITMSPFAAPQGQYASQDTGRIESRRVAEQSKRHSSFDMKLRHEPNEVSVIDKEQALKMQVSKKFESLSDSDDELQLPMLVYHSALYKAK